MAVSFVEQGCSSLRSAALGLFALTQVQQPRASQAVHPSDVGLVQTDWKVSLGAYLQRNGTLDEAFTALLKARPAG